MPEEFYGKKVEVTIVEVADTFKVKKHGVPPRVKKVDLEKLFEAFGANPDFPSIEQIRAVAWS